MGETYGGRIGSIGRSAVIASLARELGEVERARTALEDMRALAEREGGPWRDSYIEKATIWLRWLEGHS